MRDNEKRLRHQLRNADAEQIAQLKADVEALVGALHQSTVENGLPRQKLADHVAVVRVLPTQPGIGDSPHPGPPGLR